MFGRSRAATLVAAVLIPVPAAAAPTLAQRLDALVAAYPEIDRHDGTRLYLSDGGPPLVIDDGTSKTHGQKLADADIEDMLSQVYPLGPCAKPSRNFDPGRIRAEPLLRRLYGDSREAVAARVRRLDWFGTRLAFTKVAQADEALERVRAEIAELPAALQRPARKTSGTFNWRMIAGTRQLSVHSFAAAIDLDTGYADYWRWSGGKAGDVAEYRNRIPQEIVDIFERHGFIWGGKWYHYDTMHFEYRPEMIAIGRLSDQGC